MSITNELNYAQYLIYGQSDGDNLDGFEIDVNAYICNEENCFYISEERSADMNCMLTLYCKFSSDFNYQRIADYLEEKWLNSIRYPDFAKHHIEVVGDQLNFYYVTRSKVGLGVTGKIVAS